MSDIIKPGQQARVKPGYEAWYAEWMFQPENRFHGLIMATLLKDGDIVTVLDMHAVDGLLYCRIKAPGVGGSIQREWLEPIA